jgi:hypothetical protein
MNRTSETHDEAADADKYRLWQSTQMLAAMPEFVPVIRDSRLVFISRADATEVDLALETATRDAHNLPEAQAK